MFLESSIAIWYLRLLIYFFLYYFKYIPEELSFKPLGFVRQGNWKKKKQLIGLREEYHDKFWKTEKEMEKGSWWNMLLVALLFKKCLMSKLILSARGMCYSFKGGCGGRGPVKYLVCFWERKENWCRWQGTQHSEDDVKWLALIGLLARFYVGIVWRYFRRDTL